MPNQKRVQRDLQQQPAREDDSQQRRSQAQGRSPAGGREDEKAREPFGESGARVDTSARKPR